MTWWERFNSRVLFTIACLAYGGTVHATEPVLVELFTSEGCSSCPPADAVLQALKRTQPIAGATVIAMSEHVDYWNRLGWRDPFSSAQMSARQQAYARHLGSGEPYTPQMVIDGVEEFVGSDASRAKDAIAKAAQRQKLSLTVAPAGPEAVHLAAPAAPAGAEVWIATVYDPDPSAVSRGENSGRHLTHISVVRSLTKVGQVTRNKPWDAQVPLPHDAERLVIFLQERGQGRVLAAVEINARRSAGNVARWSPQK
jgi:hypothetical protein